MDNHNDEDDVVMSECVDCGEMHEQSDMTNLGDERDNFVCESCISDYVECERPRCYRMISPNRDTIYTVNRQRQTYPYHYYAQSWCDECTQNHATECNRCDEYFADADGLTFEVGIDQYCEACYQEVRDEQEAERERNAVHDYSTDVVSELGIAAVPDKLCLGFEIEVEVRPQRESVKGDAVEALYERAAGRAIAKHDGSIDYGFEIVSAPFVLDDSRKLVDDVFGKPIEGLTGDRHTVGMHVHMSRSVLHRSQMAKMLVFTEAIGNEEFMTRMAGRDIRRNHYASNRLRDSWKSVFCNDYHKGRKISKFRKTFDRNARFMSERPNTETDGVRYAVLNFLNAQTVECRMFQSTTDPKRIKANLEFCAALVEFCGHTRSYSQLGSPKWFIDFVFANRKEYPNLNEFILASHTGAMLQRVAQSKSDLRSVRKAVGAGY